MAKSFKSEERGTTNTPDSSPLISNVSEFGVHSESVLAWRVQAFTRMGFTEFVSDFLGSTRIDLHRMSALLDAGCPHDIAAQILMGTMWSGDDDLWRFTDEASYLEGHDTETPVETSSNATP